MHLIHRLLCTTILLGLAGAYAYAAPAAPQNGNEYMTLPTAQPTDSGRTVCNNYTQYRSFDGASQCSAR